METLWCLVHMLVSLFLGALQGAAVNDWQPRTRETNLRGEDTAVPQALELR